jgi:hypothetical protein
VHGRIGALIEVGAGFHPDLTGRENVMLQGVIMGMPRKEVARKFDQIVEFSGIAPFIDTPVKRYSSGMHARLGFAIAAHLDPDVLIIDEALAVGDAEFQRKALGRVRELLGAGIPTLVVSHQLDVIASLCTHALLLDRGVVVAQGDPRECIAAYLDGKPASRDPSAGDGAIRVERLDVDRVRAESGESIAVALDCAVRDDGWVEPESVRLRLRAAHTGDMLFETGTDLLGHALPRSGAFQLSIDLQLNVPPGVYILESFAWDRIMSRISFVGPTAHVEVTGGSEFLGSVQLNARARLEPESSGSLRAVEGR